jgi:transposase-like protein
MAEISYRRHRFPPVIIQHAVWLYLRFTLSYRDVEELLAERELADKVLERAWGKPKPDEPGAFKKMPPEEERARVAELLAYAASLRVPHQEER